MEVLDLGAGTDIVRWLPGADVADNNIDSRKVLEDISEPKVFRGFFGEDQIPMPDGWYDLVWYSYGWYTVSMGIRRKVAKEITRVTAPHATLVLRDYCSYYNYSKDRDVPITAKQWKRVIEVCFPEWEIDGLYTELAPSCDVPQLYDDEFCVVAILTKGWEERE